MNIDLKCKKIWVLVGTRPEVIKQVPLYLALVEKFQKENVALIGTGQHKDLLDQALASFGLELDINLNLMRPGQSLEKMNASVLEEMGQMIKEYRPEYLIVQGDTSSAAMTAWAGFLNKIKIIHNEAGLRSFDMLNPFPEEANRRLIGIVADIHMAPTEMAKCALLSEGIPSEKIFVTGNTGIDALKMTLERAPSSQVKEILEDIKNQNLDLVLLTAHRRENLGKHLKNMFKATKRIVDEYDDIKVIYPIHRNPLLEK